MNKFRVNLHPALFGNLDGGAQEAPKENLENFSKEELDQLKKDIIEEVSWKKKNKIEKRQGEEHDKIKGETNGNIWTNNIIEWYGRLITALRDNHYFDGKNEQEEIAELGKIKTQYQEEVKRQYKKIVWDSSDTNFDTVDDNLFDKDSPNSPANKIYRTLTWAATISTVDRQYTEWYKVDLFEKAQEPSDQPENTPDTPETEIDRKNRQFLSNDLPEYLWNIRKTPWVLNVIKWLPIFSVKVDRPSEVDRDAISDFLKAANRIPTKNGKSPVMVLIESLHDNRLNTDSTVETYMEVLEKHWMDKQKLISRDYKQFKKCMSSVMEVWKFYINTQKSNKDVKDQHVVYLSVLGIIEDSQWAENAVKKFEKVVEDAKTDKKTEKKEWYASGEKLWSTNSELYEIATNLWITDFASATRLSEKDADYFKNTPVEKILANLNNDETINARDVLAGWSKSGVQFLEIFNQVWKEKALTNLVERAKLLNKTLWVGLPDALFNMETVESYIQDGHTGLILLLQNIISKPGEDLYALLSGHTENPFEAIDAELKDAERKSEEVAADMVKKVNFAELANSGINIDPGSLQSWLAATLYSEYKRWIWLWWKISFDQWIKWVEMDTWFQIREDGGVVIWIWLDYHKVVNMWNWWTLTPALEAWTFVPLFDAKMDASVGGVSVELAKNRITKNWIHNKLWFTARVKQMLAWATVLSAWFDWSRDKVAGIESEEQKKKWEMEKEISTVLTNLSHSKWSWGDKLDFANESMVTYLKEQLKNLAKKLKVEDKDIDVVVNTTLRLLVPDNWTTLTEEHIQLIAQGVSEQYAMAWAEDRKAHITDKAYLSWASLGAFWVVGSPLVWVYAWVKVKKHDLDGYGDKWWKEGAIDNSERKEEARTPETLQSLNARLGLSGAQALSFVDEKNPNKGIKIPSSLRNRVKVSKSMEWKLTKDESGNAIVSQWATMGESIRAWAATQSRELLIWTWEESDFVHLDTVGDNWFVDKIDNVNTIMLEQSNEGFYTTENIKNAIEKLKNDLKDKNPILEKLNPTEQQLKQVKEELDAIQDKSKKAKITIEGKPDWSFDMHTTQGDHEWRWLELEYKAKLEMVDTDAKAIADAVYTEALKLKNPIVLNAVKHNKSWEKDYAPFRDAMNAKNYEKAKVDIVPIFKRLDDEIKDGNINFSNILNSNTFNGLKWDSLAQAMMAINNIFARSKQVRWWNEEYEFKWPNGKSKEMRAIIKERYNILKTLKWKVNDKDAIKRYESLFNATSKYIDKPDFAKTSAKAASLWNTVGFNLGDKTNPENPLFNPEIYDPMVELDKLEWFSTDAREGLHKRAMKMFAENPALINPVLKLLWVETEKLTPAQLKQAVDKGTINITDDNKCQIILDIWGKNITLSSWMKFWFFTQCVNHTIILSDITAESEGTNVEFSSWVWNNWRYVEWNKSSIIATTEVGVSWSVIVHGGQKEEPHKETQEEGETEMWWGKVPETTPIIIEYDNNWNPVVPPVTPTPVIPPVAPVDNSWVSSSGGWRS